MLVFFFFFDFRYVMKTKINTLNLENSIIWKVISDGMRNVSESSSSLQMQQIIITIIVILFYCYLYHHLSCLHHHIGAFSQVDDFGRSTIDCAIFVLGL